MSKFRTLSLIVLTLFLALSISSCKTTDNDNSQEQNETHDDNCIYTPYFKTFSSFSEFEDYVYNDQNPKADTEIYQNHMVNFDTVIPNNEIFSVSLSYNKNAYTIEYSSTQIQVIYKSNISAEDFFPNATRVEGQIENLTCAKKGWYVLTVGETDIFYSVNEKQNYNGVSFALGENYVFHLRFSDNNNRPEAQKAFVEAFMTEAGTAEMLERIKALIPEEIE